MQLIFLSEVFKMLVSAVLVLSGDSAVISKSKHSVFDNCKRLCHLLSSGKEMLLLVALYNISNFCHLYATAVVGASVSNLFCQLKILTTAVCGKIFLSKSYSTKKWICLVALMIGVTCVSYPVVAEASNNNFTNEANVVIEQTVLGIFLLLIQVSISGYASVYFERVLKDEHVSLTIWERNFQLAAFSILFTFIMMLCKHIPNGAVEFQFLSFRAIFVEMYTGWTMLAFTTSFCLGSAGIFTAATLKYADAVLKCFANCTAIIIVTVINVSLFGGYVDCAVLFGIALSIIAMLTYSMDSNSDTMTNIAKKDN